MSASSSARSTSCRNPRDDVASRLQPDPCDVRSDGGAPMTTVRDARRPTVPRPPSVAPPPERRPFRDNPRLILLGLALLFAALVAMIIFADRSPGLNPDFLTEVVLYALS